MRSPDEIESKAAHGSRRPTLLLRRACVRPAGIDLPAELTHRDARRDQPHSSARDECEQILASLVDMFHRRAIEKQLATVAARVCFPPRILELLDPGPDELAFELQGDRSGL